MPSPSVKSTQSAEFFGVDVENLTRDAVKTRIVSAFASSTRLRVATVNPEYLLEARGNARFRESLRKAEVRVADGAGVTLVARFLGRRIERIPGADLMLEALGLAEASGVPTLLIVNESGLSSYDEIRQALITRFPRLDVSRFEGQAAPERCLVLCNYGAPLQEFVLEQLPGGGVRMGVGGAFDYLTGKLPRAPRFLRSLGFEWLWRLFLQPRRIKRIWNAVIFFPILAIFDTIRR